MHSLWRHPFHLFVLFCLPHVRSRVLGRRPILGPWLVRPPTRQSVSSLHEGHLPTMIANFVDP